MIFRPFPPAPQETRAFAVFFFGSVLALVLVAVLAWKNPDGGFRGLMMGAGAAILWRLGRAAFDLEKKAERAKHLKLEPTPEGLKIRRGEAQELVEWLQFSRVEMRGGRLHLEWPNGNLEIGSREWENGMDLVQTIAKSAAKPQKPANFIPLEPR